MPSVAVLNQPLLPNSQAGAIDGPTPHGQDAHTFKRPVDGDVRGICPALNTLSNHSYLPHDGKDITFSTLAHGLETGYGISKGFANFLVLGSYLLLKRDPLKPLDLHEIARSGRIEHPASVVHDDANGTPYAPEHVNMDLLQKFLSKAYSPADLRASEGDDVITIADIAHTRVAREALSAPIDSLHAEIARGEFAMVLNIFGKGSGKTLNKEDLKAWLTENRLPDGWAPSHEETLKDTVAESKEMRELVHAFGAGGKEEHHGLWASIEKTVEGLLAQVGSAVHSHTIDAKNVGSISKLQATTELEGLRIKAKF